MGMELRSGKYHVPCGQCVYHRAAQFEGLPAEASYRLQKVGGAILGMVR